MWSWWKQGSAGGVSHHQSELAVDMGGTAGRAGNRNSKRQPSSSYSFFFGYHWYHASENLHPNKNWSNNKSLTWSIYKFTTLDFRKKKDDIPTEIPGPTTSENPPLGLSVCSEKPTSPEATPPQKQGLNHRVTILLIYDQAFSTPFFWRDISRPFHGATFEKLPCHTDSWAFTSCEERFLLEPCDFPLLERDFCLTLALYQERKIAGSKNGLQTNQQV